MGTEHNDSDWQSTRGTNQSVTASLPVEGGVTGAVRVCLAGGEFGGATCDRCLWIVTSCAAATSDAVVGVPYGGVSARMVRFRAEPSLKIEE